MSGMVEVSCIQEPGSPAPRQALLSQAEQPLFLGDNVVVTVVETLSLAFFLATTTTTVLPKKLYWPPP